MSGIIIQYLETAYIETVSKGQWILKLITKKNIDILGITLSLIGAFILGLAIGVMDER